MLRSLWNDRKGQYAMLTAIVMLPLMGGLAVGVDYAEMSRQRSLALNALDAASIGAARRYLEGNITAAQLQTYAEEFFAANYGNLDASKVELTLVLPNDSTGGGTLKLSANMKYSPYFLPALTALLGDKSVTEVKFNESSEVRLKNTLEVALVLDNSGSMSEKGGSSGTVRMDLLKTAAKQLVDTLAAQGNQMKQVEKPVQFSVVPFASSVNIGNANATAKWMDQDGISPIHHENFDWTTMGAANSSKRVEKVGGIYYKKGSGWGTQENQKVTRFTMYEDVKRISGWTNNVSSSTPGAQYYCTRTRSGVCTAGYYRAPQYSTFTSWSGCVEARPSPYDVNDAEPVRSDPATMFVPMYGPDESSAVSSYNSWLPDVTAVSSNAARQRYMPKYFTPSEMAAESIRSSDNVIVGPNQSCTTTPITPLKEVTTSAGLKTIKDSIDAMKPLGGTNVPEGMAWGWRTISSALPFDDGRSETEKGNDKVLIVVTDGANTYYTPDSLGWSDSAGNKSIYSSLGYAKLVSGTDYGRIFGGTGNSISKTDYTNTNYTNAMNEHFTKLCDNAKAAKVMVMTVAVDLNSQDTAENTQINMLKSCASPSRYRKNADGTPAALFWNSTGASLANDFKEIGNELSNLRIVS